MPYTTSEVDGYQVKNTRTGKVHAKSTSKAKADAQMRLLHGVEHGMVPRTSSQVAGLSPSKSKSKGKSKASRSKSSQTKGRSGNRGRR